MPPAHEAAGEDTADTGPNLPWYIIHTYSRFENKVKDEPPLARGSAWLGAAGWVEILIPTEDVRCEMRNGKKVTSQAPAVPRLRPGPAGP